MASLSFSSCRMSTGLLDEEATVREWQSAVVLTWRALIHEQTYYGVQCLFREPRMCYLHGGRTTAIRLVPFVTVGHLQPAINQSSFTCLPFRRHSLPIMAHDAKALLLSSSVIGFQYFIYKHP